MRAALQSPDIGWMSSREMWIALSPARRTCSIRRPREMLGVARIFRFTTTPADGQGARNFFSTRNQVVSERTMSLRPFFCPYSPGHVQACEAGLECARRAAQRSDFAILGDSAVDCEELVALGAARENCRILRRCISPNNLPARLSRSLFSSDTPERDPKCFLSAARAKQRPPAGAARLCGYHHLGNPYSRLIFAEVSTND